MFALDLGFYYIYIYNKKFFSVCRCKAYTVRSYAVGFFSLFSDCWKLLLIDTWILEMSKILRNFEVRFKRLCLLSIENGPFLCWKLRLRSHLESALAQHSSKALLTLLSLTRRLVVDSKVGEQLFDARRTSVRPTEDKGVLWQTDTTGSNYRLAKI